MSLPNDQYNRPVTMATVGQLDVYTVTNPDATLFTVSFPTGTSTGVVYNAINANYPPDWFPPLAQCQQINLLNFSAALQQFVSSILPLETQFRMFMLYYTAVQNGLTNRAAYLAPLLAWVAQIEGYAATYTASVLALNDPATAYNSQWNFGSIPSIPSITLLGAIQINN